MLMINTVVIGAAARHLPFPREKWETVIRSTVPPKTIEINLAAFHAGFGE